MLLIAELPRTVWDDHYTIFGGGGGGQGHPSTI